MAQDMTHGPITPLLVRFTIPLVLGNLFQLAYNAADSIIVGQYVGADALAAVGTCGPVMTLAILFINGACLGAGILISVYYGAGDTPKMERQISTTALAGCAFCIGLSLACMLCTGPILRLLQVPQDIMPLATGYMRIIFAGLVFTFFYNFLASTLRALGDSRSALYFLVISATLNVAGDLFFVLVLHMGAQGCALATVLSQALCCVLCLAYIQRRVPLLRLGRRWLVFDAAMLWQAVRYGWASALQQASVQLGKVCVQAMVNTMGVSAMAAFAAVSRIDDFAYIPQQNIGHAMTTLMAQNRGAGKFDRVRASFICGMRIEWAYALAIMAVCFAGARPLLGLFVDDAQVAGHGVRFLRLVSLLYLLPAHTNGIQGFFRGMGDLKITLRTSLLNMGMRVGVVALMVFVFHWELDAIPLSYAAGWVAMLLYEVPVLVRWLRRGLEQKATPTR